MRINSDLGWYVMALALSLGGGALYMC
jgi:hypothetical protein